MRFVDDRWEQLPTFNECARRLLEVATTFGCASSSLARVPGKPQTLLGGEFRVSPRDLLCGVSLPGGDTGAVGVDERVEGASRRPTWSLIFDVDQVEQAAPPVRPLIEPHLSVASFDDANQVSDEVDGLRTVIPLAVSSVNLHGNRLVHAFLLAARIRPKQRGEAPAEPARLPRT